MTFSYLSLVMSTSSPRCIVLRILFYLLLLITLFSCASRPSRPQLYPNDLYKKNGADTASLDIEKCIEEANAYLKTEEGKNLQASFNTGSVSTSFGFGYGPRGGSSVGVGFGSRPYYSSRLSSSEKVIRRYSEECLINKGYQIMGWATVK